MKTKTTIPWRAILLESGFVVLGLVLALLANGWLDGRREQERADAAMTAVIAEVRANQVELHKTVKYHAEVLQALAEFGQEHADDSEAIAPWSLFPKGFILPANIGSHAWDMASASGSIERVPYQQLLEVSRLYQSQRQYQALLTQVSDEIYRRIYDAGRTSLRRNWKNHSEILSALVYRECLLARDYAEALPRLSEAGHQTVAAGLADGQAEPPDYCSYLPRL